MLDKICTEELHTCDVISCVFYNGYIYTGGDDGLIKVYTVDLKPVFSWKAHEQVVYDLAVNPNNGDIYSCSLDGQILQWRIDLQSKHAQLINSATQTGPSGKGQGLPGVGEVGSLEDSPANVSFKMKTTINFTKIEAYQSSSSRDFYLRQTERHTSRPLHKYKNYLLFRKLFWRGDHLYAGDELGSICRFTHFSKNRRKPAMDRVLLEVRKKIKVKVYMFRWTADLKLELKQEYFTEIWCLYVNEDESLIYSGRDNDIVIASLPQKASLEARCVQVKGNLAGRCPVVANKDDSIIVIVNRNGMQVDIWSNKDGNERTKIQTLKDHDMIVNCISMDPSDKTLITAGWDAKVNFWKRGENGVYSLTKSVKVDSYVNCLSLTPRCVYACGKNGYIAKINK